MSLNVVHSCFLKDGPFLESQDQAWTSVHSDSSLMAGDTQMQEIVAKLNIIVCGNTIICAIVSHWNWPFTNRHVHWTNNLWRHSADSEGHRAAESNHVVFFCVSGHAPGQLYTYPARCWRKKRRLNILEDPRLVPIEFKIGECWGKR